MENKSYGIKDYFITGLIVLMPFLITLWLSVWIAVLAWQRFLSIFVPGVDAIIRATLNADTIALLEAWHFPEIVGFLLLLLFVIVIGFVARRYIGISLIALITRIIEVIPGLNFIYSTVRQLTATMDPESPQHDAFKNAVLAKLGDAEVIGFLTSHSLVGKRRYATVFVPCNQLVQGYSLFIPEENVRALDLKVDDAIKYVISFGMVAPSEIKTLETGRRRKR